MAAGLIQYTVGRENLPQDANVVPNPLPGSGRLVAGAGAAVVVAAVALTGLVNAANLAFRCSSLSMVWSR